MSLKQLTDPYRKSWLTIFVESVKSYTYVECETLTVHSDKIERVEQTDNIKNDIRCNSKRFLIQTSENINLPFNSYVEFTVFNDLVNFESIIKITVTDIGQNLTIPNIAPISIGDKKFNVYINNLSSSCFINHKIKILVEIEN